MTLGEFLEQMVIIECPSRHSTLGKVLERMVALAPQFIAKYLWDTYDIAKDGPGAAVYPGYPVYPHVIEVGEGDEEEGPGLRTGGAAGTDACTGTELGPDAGSRIRTVKECIMEQLRLGVFDTEYDASRARRFISCQRETGQCFGPLSWSSGLHVVFPRYCHPFDMGAVEVPDEMTWSMSHALDCLKAFSDGIDTIADCPFLSGKRFDALADNRRSSSCSVYKKERHADKTREILKRDRDLRRHIKLEVSSM
jgi:hypothetical protein